MKMPEPQNITALSAWSCVDHRRPPQTTADRPPLTMSTWASVTDMLLDGWYAGHDEARSKGPVQGFRAALNTYNKTQKRVLTDTLDCLSCNLPLTFRVKREPPFHYQRRCWKALIHKGRWICMCERGCRAALSCVRARLD